MPRTLIIALVGFMLLGCAAASMAASMEMPESVTMSTTADGYTPKKGAVTFNHASHMDIPCLQCHHTVADTYTFQSCGSEGCHDNVATRTDTNSVYWTFHTTKNTTASCVGCHRDLKKKGASDAPLACNSCHEK